MKLFSYLKINLNLKKSQITALYNEGRVTINNEHLPLSCPVREGDIVRLDNEIIKMTEFKYYLYYKPRGVLSIISDSQDSYINKINSDIKLMCAGRLDKDSEGLMLLSNDGKFINEVISKDSSHEKEYIIETKYPITNSFIEGMGKSYTIRGRATTPFRVKRIDSFHLSLILYEGIYHEIRTVTIMNNNRVVMLKRIRIRDFTLGDLKPGEMREIKMTGN